VNISGSWVSFLTPSLIRHRREPSTGLSVAVHETVSPNLSQEVMCRPERVISAARERSERRLFPFVDCYCFEGTCKIERVRRQTQRNGTQPRRPTIFFVVLKNVRTQAYESNKMCFDSSGSLRFLDRQTYRGIGYFNGFICLSEDYFTDVFENRRKKTSYLFFIIGNDLRWYHKRRKPFKKILITFS